MPTQSTAPTESSHSSYATGTMTRMMRDELPPGLTADDLQNQGVSAPPAQLDSFREDFEGYSPEDVAHEFFNTQEQGDVTIEVQPHSAIQEPQPKQPASQPSRKPSTKVDPTPKPDADAKPFYCKTWFIVVAVALIIGGVAGGIGGALASSGGGSSSSSNNVTTMAPTRSPPTAPTPPAPTAEPSSAPSSSPSTTPQPTMFNARSDQPSGEFRRDLLEVLQQYHATSLRGADLHTLLEELDEIDAFDETDEAKRNRKMDDGDGPIHVSSIDHSIPEKEKPSMGSSIWDSVDKLLWHRWQKGGLHDEDNENDDNR